MKNDCDINSVFANDPEMLALLCGASDKDVAWSITSQTGARASLSGTNGSANTLNIPAKYRGMIYIQAGIRTFRIIVTR